MGSFLPQKHKGSWTEETREEGVCALNEDLTKVLRCVSHRAAQQDMQARLVQMWSRAGPTCTGEQSDRGSTRGAAVT